MFDPGDLIEFMKTELGLEIIRPSGTTRPELPYYTLVDILGEQPEIHQHGTTINDGVQVIQLWRRTQFSLTAIGTVNTTDAADKAQAAYNLMHTQIMTDFLSQNGLVLRISGMPKPRYILQDNFNEARWGFDIEIGDIVNIGETEKETIEEVVITNTDNFIEPITVEQGS